ncbi:MAG: type II toxin-antitoxin system death-on-curing family toxin [Deltaproteobacteria bacterium]|nr:type II toxin-antitoxin system death-on-curing family toxin [Deltaproteobacteria bacterium]
MSATIYPTVEEVLVLHSLLLARYGGEAGVRDLGMLDAALHRPRSGYYASLSEQAAALLQSLANNHAFVDGNKRVAFATMAIFLRLNGFALRATADDAEAFLIDEVIRTRALLQQIARSTSKDLELFRKVLHGAAG